MKPEEETNLNTSETNWKSIEVLLISEQLLNYSGTGRWRLAEQRKIQNTNRV